MEANIVLENDTIEILLNNINLLGEKVAIAPILKSTKKIIYTGPIDKFFNYKFGFNRTIINCNYVSNSDIIEL